MAPTHLLAFTLAGTFPSPAAHAIAAPTPLRMTPGVAYVQSLSESSVKSLAAARSRNASTERMLGLLSLRAGSHRFVVSGAQPAVVAPIRQGGSETTDRACVIPGVLLGLECARQTIEHQCPVIGTDATGRGRTTGEEHPNIRGPPGRRLFPGGGGRQCAR